MGILLVILHILHAQEAELLIFVLVKIIFKNVLL
jgi:hypothetical protein